MKNTIKVRSRNTRLVALMCLVAGVGVASSAWAGQWRWSEIPGISAKAAMPSANKVVALDASSYVSGQGYLVRRRHVDYGPWESLGGRGTSLAVDNGVVYVVAEDDRVWKYFENGAWGNYPSNKCEGGSMSIRQTVGDNNLAVTRGQIYVVSSGRTRWWNGSCWYKMPSLPSGTPRDISPSPTDQWKIWAVNQYDTIYSWTNDGWVEIEGGTAPGLGVTHVIGSDDRSVWRYQTGGGFSFDSTWVGERIEQLGGTSGTAGFWTRTAVTPEGDVYWYGYHAN